MQFDDLQTAVPQILRAWSNLADTATAPLSQLLLVQQAQARTTGSTSAVHQVLLDAIQQLQQQDPTSAQILTARFVDGQTILMAASKLNLSEDQVKRRQREAIRNLTQLLWDQETAVRQKRLHTLQAQLPPPTYTNLFGSQHHIDELIRYLAQPALPGVVAIVGIGGIGKTALADQVVRTILPRFTFQNVVWLRVSPDETHSDLQPALMLEKIVNGLAEQVCPQTASSGNGRIAGLRQTFKTQPTLVIIDNLESEADTSLLLNALNDWAIPSKFLLTTRTRLPAASAAYSLVLDELPLPTAANLITAQAQNLNLTDLEQAPDSVIRQIYAATGGNPLALKLVVGLTAVLPLQQILTDLTAAQISEIGQLYRHIYWQAWHSLSPTGQTLLEMMPLAAGVGVRPAQMQAMSGLTEQQLWPAITELVNRSLLEVRGTTWERRYGIHRLTESFLRTEIIHWPESP